MWKGEIGSNALKEALKKSAACCYYLIEYTWFVMNVETYLKPIEKSCKNKKMRVIIRQLRMSEKNHYQELLKTLKLKKIELMKHDPSPGTILLIQYLKQIGQEDPLSFLVSASLLEADPLTIKASQNFFYSIERKIKINLQAFRNHQSQDMALGHMYLWEAALKIEEDVTNFRMNKIINQIHVTRHVLQMWKESLSFRCKEANEMQTVLNSKKLISFIRTPFEAKAFL